MDVLLNEEEELDKEIAIDPEMLGKTFEKLLDITERGSKGTFYTPREIVKYMCEEVLIQHLLNESDFTNHKESLKNFVKLCF